MEFPRPDFDTGIGVHSDPNAYFKPADPHGYAHDLWNHGVRWYLAWLFDENNADYIKIMRQQGIEVIMRLGPAYMPHPNISMGVVDAYVAAGVRWAIIGNEWNLHEEWQRENAWQGLEKPIRMCADQFIKYADVMRPKGLWCLTPPPSLGGHWLHRDWFNRFCTALTEIARERGQTFEQLLWHCGIGIHCRSVGNPLDKGPGDYDCSAREWEWFRDTVKSFQSDKSVVIPMANTEAFDEPQWLPKMGSEYDWNLWRDRNLQQMRWFNPANAGYKYPLQIMCNCHWVVHADRFSPWPQCGLFSNYIHYIQRGDYTTDLWRAMPGVINWQRGEPQPPQPPTPPEPPAPAGEIDFVGLSEEMIDMLSVSGPADKALPYWQVQSVEVQPNADNMSLWILVPDRQALPPVMFWGGGEAPMNWKEPSTYNPPGTQQGAYEMPMHDNWGLYGVRMPANSEALHGFGLYGPNLEITYTAHRPVLVRFARVEGSVVPPEPPEPPTPPDLPYELGAALSARLVAAGLGSVVDTRDAIEAKYMNAAKVGVRSVDAKDRPTGFWSVTFHHDKITYPLNVDAIAKDHTQNRGYAHIAYHFLINTDGTVWWAKRLKYYSQHCGNARFNKYSIPVAVHGDFASDSPSEAQLKALKCVTDTLEEWVGEADGKPYPLPIIRHKDIVNTACPGNLYEAYMRWRRL